MIYIIRMSGTTYTKIGYTSRNSVDSRRDELQTGCPRRLIIVSVFDGNEDDEAEIHRSLIRYKTDGGQEWFDLSDEIMNNILEEYSGEPIDQRPSGGASPHDVRPIRWGQQYTITDIRKDVSFSRSAFDHARNQPILITLRRKHQERL